MVYRSLATWLIWTGMWCKATEILGTRNRCPGDTMPTDVSCPDVRGINNSIGYFYSGFPSVSSADVLFFLATWPIWGPIRMPKTCRGLATIELSRRSSWYLQDTYQLLPVLGENTYFQTGIAVPVPISLVYFSGIVLRAPEDVRPAIVERFEKEFFDEWRFVVWDELERELTRTENRLFVGSDIVSIFCEDKATFSMDFWYT